VDGLNPGEYPTMQLREMLTALRAECGLSPRTWRTVSTTGRALVYLLDRVQLDLWEAYDWPFLTD
jgi:hypothetical protein